MARQDEKQSPETTVATRRELFGSALGAAALVAGCATGKAQDGLKAAAPTSPATGSGLPGPYPGRVVEVHDERSVQNGRIDPAIAGTMLGTAMKTLTGEAEDAAAWRRFFSPNDRVGLKVNCVGHPVPDPKKHAVYTSHEVIRSIVDALRAIGVRDIVLFDRYRMEFEKSKYPELAAELGIPWEVAAVSWDQTQIDMEGYSKGDPFAAKENAKARTDGSPKVVGYDPDVSLTLDFVHPLHDASDPRTRRSHVSNTVTKRVDKIVNLCLVKDHMAAGVTGALKNLSHGLVDNVCRSHSRASLNQTSTFIPAVVSLPIIRSKVVLNVMEGFRGIYHLGPWASPHVFEPRSLFVSTDPVAMDRVSMKIIDARRAEDGLPPLTRAGQITEKGQDEHHLFRGATHVEIAGAAGLGVYALDESDWKRWLGTDPAKANREIRLIDHTKILLS